MHAEWAKTKARADCWSEEVILLHEEMQRILWYFEWKAAWWLSQRSLRKDTSADISRGLNAYAEKQSRLVVLIARSFAKRWHPMLLQHDMPIDWPVQFIPDSL